MSTASTTVTAPGASASGPAEAPEAARVGGAAPSRPLLTIAIPTYARAARMRERLSELARVAGDDVSVVVSDNASEDGTWDLLSEAAARHPWLEISRQPANVGADRNYLRVLELARGEWCWLLGDDEPVDWSLLPELKRRLSEESAAAVHLLGPAATWRADAPTFHPDRASFVDGFYDWQAFAHLSANVLRTAVARRHLAAGAEVVGLLHAYTPIAVRCIDDGGLRVYPLPILRRRQQEAPRWSLIEGQIDAWRTMRGCFEGRLRRRVDRLEAAARAEAIAISAFRDLLGLTKAGFEPAHVWWMVRLFPAGHLHRVALPVAGSVARWSPGLFARTLVRLLRLSGRTGFLGALARDLGCATDEETSGALASAIRARAARAPIAKVKY